MSNILLQDSGALHEDVIGVRSIRQVRRGKTSKEDLKVQEHYQKSVTTSTHIFLKEGEFNPSILLRAQTDLFL